MMNYLDEQIAFKVVDNKVIIRLRDRVCETSEELIASALFRQVLIRFVRSLEAKGSPFCRLFDKKDVAIDADDIQSLIDTFLVLEKMPLSNVPKLVKNSQRFIGDVHLLFDFVEKLYDYWRSFERFLVCDSEGDRLDKRPFRTFNSTIEELTQLVRKTYRDVEENITGRHPTVYRQVAAGAELALIALPKALDMPLLYRDKLEQIHVIRQILLYPPLLLNPPMNKRTGVFQRVHENPLGRVKLDRGDWLCYPAKVGSLLILVYIHERFYELGLALANLFELADDEALQRRPDAVYLFGVPDALDDLAELPTVFYDDEEHGMLIGAVPGRDEFGYFGYLKKMVLTLHNIKMIKLGKMPYHGAMVKIVLRGDKEATILLIGDTGAGKSESLEAFRNLAGDMIQEITIIADDMGSLDIAEDGRIIGYGTEIGAFVRLDDLQPGFAFGQLDRTIIMNPAQVNARVVLPVTSFENVTKGVPVDMVLYANNYESVDDEHPILERLSTADEALHIFRQGAAMSKGTTTSTGLVHTYFVNIFGALQYREVHEAIARTFFDAFYRAGLFVGQLRTRLGISGWEMTGPRAAAMALLEFIRQK